MSDLAVTGGIADGDKSAVLDTAQVVRRARQALTVGGTPQRARDIVVAGLDKFGRSADLLWTLAEVEFVDGDVTAGRDAMKEALALAPPSSASTIQQLRMLGGSGCWREALSIVRSIPESMRQETLVRVEAGNFYRLCGCPAHAVAAFGNPKDLPRQGRAIWLSCWLRSGGPVNFLRRQAISWETEAIQELHEPPAHVEAISSVPGPDPRHVLRVRTRLETYNFHMARSFYRTISLRRMIFRLLPLAIIPVWLCLLLFAWALNFVVYPLNLLEYVTISTVIGMVLFLFVARLWFDSEGQPRVSRARMATHLTIVGGMAAGLMLSNPPISDYGTDRAIIFGLMAGVSLLTCLYLAVAFGEIYGDRRIRRIVRHDPLLSVTDQLLIVLNGLWSSSGYHGMHERNFHARLLEWAARTLVQDMLPRSTAKFLGSGDWLARRVAGWAEALRYAQRQVLVPVPDGQTKAAGLSVGSGKLRTKP